MGAISGGSAETRTPDHSVMSCIVGVVVWLFLLCVVGFLGVINLY